MRNPGAAECECCTECSWIDSAYTTIKEQVGKGMADSQYNGNEEE